MKRQWLLPPSFFLKDILGSELKISWTFFTSWFAQQQEKYIVLQSNFFTSSLHFHCNIIACNNFHHNAGILIFCVNLFLQMKEIYHQNTLKNQEIVWKFYISLILKNELKDQTSHPIYFQGWKSVKFPCHYFSSTKKLLICIINTFSICYKQKNTSYST